MSTETGRELVWQNFANCNGLNGPDELFFPDYVTGDEAKTICNGCVVQSECMEDAIKTGDTRYRGNTNHGERQRIVEIRATAANLQEPTDSTSEIPTDH